MCVCTCGSFCSQTCTLEMPHFQFCCFFVMLQLALQYRSCANPLCSCAPCRLDPRCTHLSGLHGIWRKLPSQPQYWHAAQVCSSHRTTFNFSIQFLLQVFQVFHPLVCRCYEMERRLKTPDLFKFPYFEAICWYVAKNLLEMLKGESQTFI